MERRADLGSFACGPREPLTLIAGPCVLETESMAMRIADHLRGLQDQLPVNVVFKASFDKANRTSIQSFRGVGIDRGLEMLENVRRQTGLQVTTDVHRPEQVASVAQVVDLLQIPAFLSRQTDLILAAGESGKPVHVKKGQFLAPGDMRGVVEKLQSVGCHQILLGERGTFFGYGRLVNDFTGIPIMQGLGVPVIFDATHSVQLPAGLGQTTGGMREMVAPLARAGIAVGADGVFLETHPDPDSSPSDGPNMLPLRDVRGLVAQLITIRATIGNTPCDK